MYKAVLFDMDGTIADTDGMIVATFIQLYRLYRPDYSPTIEHMLTFSGPPIFDTLQKEFPHLESQFIFDEFRRLSLPNYDKFVKPFPYVRQLVNQLHSQGIKVGIVTSKHRFASEYTLRLMKLEDAFDLLVAHDDVKMAKPDPEGIYKSMNHFGVTDKKDVLFVGDTVTDYLTAQNAGVDMALVTWTPRQMPDFVKPQYFIDSFENFIEVINHEKAN